MQILAQAPWVLHNQNRFPGFQCRWSLLCLWNHIQNPECVDPLQGCIEVCPIFTSIEDGMMLKLMFVQRHPYLHLSTSWGWLLAVVRTLWYLFSHHKVVLKDQQKDLMVIKSLCWVVFGLAVWGKKQAWKNVWNHCGTVVLCKKQKYKTIGNTYEYRYTVALHIVKQEIYSLGMILWSLANLDLLIQLTLRHCHSSQQCDEYQPTSFVFPECRMWMSKMWTAEATTEECFRSDA